MIEGLHVLLPKKKKKKERLIDSYFHNAAFHKTEERRIANILFTLSIIKFYISTC